MSSLLADELLASGFLEAGTISLPEIVYGADGTGIYSCNWDDSGHLTITLTDGRVFVSPSLAGPQGPVGSTVSVAQTLQSGAEIGSVTVDGAETKLYAPDPDAAAAPAILVLSEDGQGGYTGEDADTGTAVNRLNVFKSLYMREGRRVLLQVPVGGSTTIERFHPLGTFNQTDGAYFPVLSGSSMTGMYVLERTGWRYVQIPATTADAALSDTSENPVQNKVVKAALDAKAGIFTVYIYSTVENNLTVWHSSKTAGEIETARRAGNLVTGRVEDPDAHIIAPGDSIPLELKSVEFVTDGANFGYRATLRRIVNIAGEGLAKEEIYTVADWEIKKESRQLITVDHSLNASSGNPVRNAAVKAALDLKADSANLAAVAASGSYSDLSNTPTIPTVPQNVSAFTNDAGYLTQHQSLADYQPKSITDTGGYYTTDTVEGALQEIGAELAGINTLIGSGVIT